ncbi:MAG: histidinol-phosphate transaminase [Chitinophagaceae bacterium]|jgi:histidinol-phosphate aminotransferase|nr:histidinol-phosphate transaminase [Chitinophagaceae bacterium]MCF8288919.1 histidinol-phosphate transaminase [Chitinophagaceae bacterium]MCF8422458.1 histidinol-phosphate transaminase [Chitinophagaceae bacterium]
MAFELDKLVRPNIKTLKPYSSAKDEYTGDAKILLDANENSLGSPLTKWYNRYPDPYQQKLKDKLAFVKQIAANQIFIGNGSDECIDILFRTFCEPGKDNIIICPPTYPMYEVSANINDIAIQKAPLLSDYQLNLAHIEQLVNPNTKIIWICSPNNPTGNSLDRIDIETILNHFEGIVVVDEAYINFSKQKSFVQSLIDYPNLVVLQTLSKAWGLAGLRLGMCFASPQVIGFMNKVKAPYNINIVTQELALQALDEVGQVNDMIKLLVDMRIALAEVIGSMPHVIQVFPSDTNFILVKIPKARQLYAYLLSQGIIVRDRSALELCEDSLRITVGTEQENTLLVDAMYEWITNTFELTLN